MLGHTEGAMTEWWTYRPSDFLMFSPRVYARLIEAANESAWPAQGLGVAAALGVLVLLWRRDAWGLRVALFLLGVAWASVALLFHARHFATINSAAPVFAWAFGLQALCFLSLASWPRVATWADAGTLRRPLTLAVATAALLYPLLAPLQGRPAAQAEVFGLLPDPTVLATLAVLLGLRVPVPVVLLAWTVPLLWCAVALLLQWTLHAAAGG
jgi:hypothetical protein